MKIFFIALLLGIFIGAILRTAWDDGLEAIFDSSLSQTETASPTGESLAEKANESISNGKDTQASATDKAKDAASEIISSVKEIGPAAAAASSDLKIGNAIRSKFLIEAAIDSDKVRIDVKEGRVTLYGKVSSKDTQLLAIEIAAKTNGVDEVESKLTIETPQ